MTSTADHDDELVFPDWVDEHLIPIPQYDPAVTRGPKLNHLRTNERKNNVLKLLSAGCSMQEAAARVGMDAGSVSNWRSMDKDFRRRMELILANVSVSRDPEALMVVKKEMSFAEFRLRYFRTTTPAFQQAIVEAYENHRNGNILMVLMPPEHGKTSLFEDYASMKLALNPNMRFLVGTEAQNLGRRILNRIKNRMEPEGPYKAYVKTFGPFVPQDGDNRSSRQPWAADFFNVYKKSEHDERDYSMAAMGFNSAVAGSRTDHLHGDDLQSMKSLGMTQKIVDTFRQDWLTRPGEFGKTTINGTRVGDGDFYEEIEEQFADDEEGILTTIRLPVIVHDYESGEDRPLWPYDKATGRGYTMEQLQRLRKKVGEETWARNYMQQPRAKSSGTFTEEMFDECLDPLRSTDFLPVEGAPCIIAVDPALGGKNCIALFQVTKTRMYFIDLMEDVGLRRNEEIMSRIEQMLVRCDSMGGKVTDVIVETKNFQAGLGRDERLRNMSTHWGFALREHLTGVNKYDPDVGVPSMASDLIRHQISFPWADDMKTRNTVNEIRAQFLKWRPFMRGNRLRQDQVMVVWFAWILWNTRRKITEVDSNSFTVQGVPWQQTTTGLVIPTSGSPFYRGR